MTKSDDKSSFAEWCILEIMGHRRLGGYVTEAEVGGIPLLRIDVYRGDGSTFSQLYGKAAVYCLTPTTEDVAKAVSKDAGGPVSRWELPAQLATGEVGDVVDCDETF